MLFPLAQTCRVSSKGRSNFSNFSLFVRFAAPYRRNALFHFLSANSIIPRSLLSKDLNIFRRFFTLVRLDIACIETKMKRQLRHKCIYCIYSYYYRNSKYSKVLSRDVIYSRRDISFLHPRKNQMAILSDSILDFTLRARFHCSNREVFHARSHTRSLARHL